LHAFGVPRVKPEEIEERVVREVPNVWPKIGSTERLQLLEYVGTHGLTEQLQEVASPLNVVCVMGNAPEWVVPADVISPKWQATSSPLLPPRQRPKVEGLSAEGRLVWDRWCGLQTLHNVLSAVVTAARALPVEQRRAAAKQ